MRDHDHAPAERQAREMGLDPQNGCFLRGRLRRCLARFAVVVACMGPSSHAESPLGRKQIILFPDSMVENLSVGTFERMKKNMPHSQEPRIIAQVHCVLNSIKRANKDVFSREDWEVVVFEDRAVNAFAAPGGKIGIFEGLLDVATDQHRLAAVIGHEIAHVEARHANERMSAEFAADIGMVLVSGFMASARIRHRALSTLGFGLEVGALLPFSRAHETEADILGLDYMARAGFDPRASIPLWKEMRLQAGPKRPELLSTHPSPNRRLRDLERRMGHARELHREALSKGRLPQCGL